MMNMQYKADFFPRFPMTDYTANPQVAIVELVDFMDFVELTDLKMFLHAFTDIL